MHKLAEKIADCMKAKVEAMGIDNIQGQDLVELGMWTDIIKDIVCYDKDKKIIEAMDEAEESEEAMKYIEMYEDYPEMRRGYRGQMRDSKGRYMKRRGGRMNYEEPPYYHMTPDMYRQRLIDMKEHERDIDMDMGRMYYTEMGNSNMPSMNNNGMQMRDKKEGKSGMARKSYMETKEMHKDNTAENKQSKMKSLEDYMRELGSDLSEMLTDMSQEEKALVKQKMATIMQRI